MADRRIDVTLGINADTSAAKTQLQTLRTELNGLQSKALNVDDAGLKKAAESAKQLQVHLQNALNTNTGNIDLSKLDASLRKSKTNIQELGNGLLQAGAGGQQAFIKLAQSIANAEYPALRLSNTMKSFATTMMSTLKWQISSTILHGFIGSIQQAYGYAKDLNDSLNDIRIVTGYNVETMDRFAESANRAAKNLSTSTLDYTKAALIYYQQGDLGSKEIEERTNATIKMANVTGQAAKTVSDQMTAIWNNFDDGTKKLEYYADVVTALGAATASSSDEIAQGLEKFSAVAETVGLSYEYATSALATVTAETRQSADVVGTAFKTLFSRMQGLKLGETLEDGTTLNKYSESLLAVGINIKDSNGQLKEMDNILDEMGTKWSTLNKDQQVALAQTVGGIRQYNQLIALMDNWDTFKVNLEIAEGAEGTLEEQSKIYEESWAASSKRVRASMEELWNNMLDDDFFIGLNNGLTSVIESISNIIKGFGGVGNIIASVGAIFIGVFANKIGPLFTNIKNSIITMFVGTGKQIQGISDQAQTMMGKALKMENLTTLGKQQLANAAGLTSARAKLALVSKDLSDQERMLAEQELSAIQIQQQEVESIAKKIQKLEEEKALMMSTGPTMQGSDVLKRQKNAMNSFDKKISQVDMNSNEYIEIDTQQRIYEESAQRLNTVLETQGQKLAEVYAKKKELAASGVVQSEEAETAAIKEQEAAIQSLIDDLGTYVQTAGNIKGRSWKEAQADVQAFRSVIKSLPGDTKELENALNKALSASSRKDFSREIKNVQNHLKNLKIDAKDLDKVFESLNPDFAKKLKELLKQGSQATDELRKKQEQLNNAYNNFHPEHVMTGVERLGKIAGLAGSVSMMMSSINSLKNALSGDVEMSSWERASTIMMSMSMLLPSLISAWGSARDVLVSFTAVQNLLNAAEDKAIAKSIIKQGILKADFVQKTLLMGLEKEEIGLLGAKQIIGIKNLAMDVLRGKVKGTEAIVQNLVNLGIKEETASKIANTITTWANKTAQDGLNASMLISMRIIGAIIALVALLIVGIVSLVKHMKSMDPDKKLKAAEEASKKLNEELENTKNEVKEIKNNFDNLRNEEEILDGLVEGTEEWHKQLEKVNDETQKILDKAPELLSMENEYGQQAVQYVNGRYVITDWGEQAYKDILEQQEQQAERTAKAGLAMKLDAQQDKQDDNVYQALVSLWSGKRDNKEEEETNHGRSKSNKIQTRKGSYNARANQQSGAATDITTDERMIINEYQQLIDLYGAEHLTSKEIRDYYNEQGKDIFGSLASSKNNKNVRDEKQLSEIVEIMQKLAKEQADIDKDQRAWERTFLAETEQNLKDNSYYQTANKKTQDAMLEMTNRQVAEKVLEYTSSYYDNLTKKVDSDDDYGGSDEFTTLWDNFVKETGTDLGFTWDESETIKGSGHDRVFITTSGEEITVADLASRMAAAKSLSEQGVIEKQIEALIASTQNDSLLLSYLAGNKNLGSNATGKDINGYNIENTKKTLEEMTDEELEALGKDKDVEKDDFIEQYSKEIEAAVELWQSGWQEIQNSAAGGLSGIENVNLQASKRISTIFSNIIDKNVNGEDYVNKFVENINKGVSDLSEDDKVKVYEVMSEMDWSSWDSIDVFKERLADLGIELDLTVEEWLEFEKNMRKATNALPTDEIKNLTSAITELYAILGDEGLKKGDVISPEDLEILKQYKDNIEDLVILLANGQYKYIGDDTINMTDIIAGEDFESKVKHAKEINDKYQIYQEATENRPISDQTMDEIYGDGKDGKLGIDTAKSYGFDTVQDMENYYDTHNGEARQWSSFLGQGDIFDDSFDEVRWLKDLLKEDGAQELLQAANEDYDKETLNKIVSDGNVEQAFEVLKFFKDITDSAGRGEFETSRVEEQHASSAKDIDELQSMDISSETKEKMFDTVMDKTIEAEEIDPDTFDDYTEALQRNNVELANNEQAAQLVALAHMRLQQGVDAVAEKWDDWNTIMSKGGAIEQTEALREMNEAVSDMLNLTDEQFELLPPDFAKKNMKLMKQVADGVEGSLDKLQAKAGEEILLNITGKQSFAQMDQDLKDFHSTMLWYKDNMPTLDAEAHINDENFIATCNAIIRKAGMTKDQAQAYFAAMGYDAELDLVEAEEQSKTKVTVMPLDEEATAIAGAPVWKEDEIHEVELVTTTTAMVPAVKTITPTGDSFGGDVTVKKRTADGGGGGGGGGSGSEDKPSHKDPVRLDDSDFKPLKVWEDMLDDVARSLKKLEEASDRAFGTKKLDKMLKQMSKYSEQISIATDKIRGLNIVNQPYIDELKGYGVEFDEDGDIINFNEGLINAAEKANIDISAYNAMSTGTAQEAFEIAEKNNYNPLTGKREMGDDVDHYKHLVDEYEKNKKDKEDQEDLKEEAQYAINDLQVQRIAYKLELSLELDEYEYKQVEEQLEKLGESVFVSVEKVSTLYERTPVFEQQLEDIKAADAALEDWYKDKEKDDAYWQAKKQYRDETEEIIGLIEETEESLRDAWSNALQGAMDEVDKYRKKWDLLNDTLEHYDNLLGLIGKETDYLAKNAILGGQQKITQDQLKEAQNWLRILEEEKANYEKNRTEQQNLGVWTQLDEDQFQEDIEKVDNAIYNETVKIQGYVEDIVENAKTQFENVIQEIRKELDSALAGKNYDTLEELSTQLERSERIQEGILTKTNQLYETSTLAREAQLKINQTDNQVIKSKYNDYIKYVKKLGESNQLSEQDLNVAKEKFNLLQAEIALEEARNAKDQVRLSRDAEGNWGYVYTANQDNVAQAEQKVEDSKNALYNIGLDSVQVFAQKSLEIRQSFLEEWEKIENDFSLSDEERWEKRKELASHYDNLMVKEKEKYYSSMDLMAENSANHYVDYTGLMVEATISFTDIATSGYETIDQASQTFRDITKEVLDQTNTNIFDFEQSSTGSFSNVTVSVENLDSSIGELTTESGVLKDYLVNDLHPTLDNLITKTGDAATKTSEHGKALQDTKTDAENLVDEINEQLLPALREVQEYDIDPKEFTVKADTSAAWAELNRLASYNPPEIVQVIRTVHVDDGGGGGGGNKAPAKAGSYTANNTMSAGAYIDYWDKNGNYVSGKTSVWVSEDDPNFDWSKVGTTETKADPQTGKETTVYNLGNDTYVAYGDSGSDIIQFQYNGQTMSLQEAMDYRKEKGFDTGGRTSNWGSNEGMPWANNGKYAILHPNERILNAKDTQDFDKITEIIKEIGKNMDKENFNLNFGLQSYGRINPLTEAHEAIIQQHIVLQAEFPNVQDHNEIEIALQDMINQSSQYAYRTTI